MQMPLDFAQRVRSVAMESSTANGRPSQRPAIADVLREGIRQGMLAPGQPLIQASIAEAMGFTVMGTAETLAGKSGFYSD